MGFELNARSLNNLKGVNPAMVDIVHRAAELSPVYFVVTEGLRTVKRQAELVAKGASRTMNSKHLTGRAVDVAAFPNPGQPGLPGKLSWEFRYYKSISEAFKQAAKELGIKIRWGGDWKSFVDSPHFELI
jgi:peptidoglycan L-alanyl-D-glutamate endopeptidase CwlK